MVVWPMESASCCAEAPKSRPINRFYDVVGSTAFNRTKVRRSCIEEMNGQGVVYANRGQ